MSPRRRVLAALLAGVTSSFALAAHAEGETACRAALEEGLAVALAYSGAPVLARPSWHQQELLQMFEVSEQQLLGCQALGFVPYRFGHALLCVVQACDAEDLVRALALPAFLAAMGVEIPADQQAEMIIGRLAHWKEMKADFVVAGFESGGTTSLVHHLQTIPDIYMMPFEFSDWARDFTRPRDLPVPECETLVSYWPAFMSFAFWPAAETVERFNQQASRCGWQKRIGVWDSRYATHPIAVRKIQALLADKASARVILCFRDPIRYVVSTFNRLSPEHPGGRSLLALVEGEEGDPDPFGLKGNYTLLMRDMARAVGWERLHMQPFDLLLGGYTSVWSGRIGQTVLETNDPGM
ncbi:unnamed protein product [Durusdinium trenchii]|uniref:Sulfotransferase n=1 Tax=Durusdinium trenchii TaxID=1381693 RepID=A0ABP0M682_9DINO